MSDFVITRPVTLFPGGYTTNIPTSPPAAYDAGTTYAAGTLVSLLSGFNSTTATVYESLISGNTGNFPSTSPAAWKEKGRLYADWDSSTAYVLNAKVNYLGWLYLAIQAGTNQNPYLSPLYWKRVGGSNAYAAFDDSSARQAEWADQITYSIPATGVINDIGLLNLNASSVTIVVTDTAGEIYNQTHSLIDNSMIDDVFAYFYEPIVFLSDLKVSTPNALSPTVDLSFDGEGQLGVGHIVVGQARVLGKTLYGASVGITDYSRVEQDEYGSPPYIVQRLFNKRGRFIVSVPAANSDSVFNTLAEYRATAVLIAASAEYSSTVTFGLLQEWEILFETYGETKLSITTRGLQ